MFIKLMVLAVSLLAGGMISLIGGIMYSFDKFESNKMPVAMVPLLWLASASMAVGFLGTIVLIVLRIIGAIQ